MHNIPPLNRSQTTQTRLNKRVNRLLHGEHSTKKQLILSKADRRKKQKRRINQVTVSFERRASRNIRRKSDYLALDAEQSSGLSDTVGKFINTEV